METNKIYNQDFIIGIKNIEDESVDLVITDPPYNVNYGNKAIALSRINKAGDAQIARDAQFLDKFNDHTFLSKELFRVMKNNSHVYIFCSEKQIINYISSMVSAGFKSPQLLIWNKFKPTFDITFGHKFPENKEIILFFQKGWRKLNGYSIERSKLRSILNFKSNGDLKNHGCSKPIELISFLTKLSSDINDVCLDCFVGGGEPHYCF